MIIVFQEWWDTGCLSVICGRVFSVRIRKQQPALTAGCWDPDRLYIEVEIKFMRMRPQFDVIYLVFGFIVDPHVDGILGEDIAL